MPPPGAEQPASLALPGMAWAQPPPGLVRPAPGWAQPGYPAAQPASNGLATASLVLGITSIVFCWWGLLTLAQVVLAIAFGVIGLNRANACGGNRIPAIAGLICGCIGAMAYFVVGLLSFGAGFIV